MSVQSFRYRAIARDQYGQEVVTVFTSNVEYVPGDELSRHNVRWHVETVQQDGTARIDADGQAVRELRCVLK